MDLNLAGNSTSVSVSSACPPYTKNILLLALNVVDSTLALPSVSWALWLLIRGPHKTLETELFFVNIICLDMVCVLVRIGGCLNDGFLHNQILAVCNEMVHLLCLYGHPILQCCVCFERYLAVVHPLTILKYRPMRYKVIALFVVWPVTLVFSLAHHFSLDPHVLLMYLLPVICIESFCSLSILRVLKNNGPRDEPKKKEREKERNRTKKNAFVVVAILQITQLLNYSPYVIVNLFRDVFPTTLYNCYLFSTTICIALFGSFIQAFLYLQRTGRLSIILRF